MTYKLTNTSINPDPYYGAVSLLLSGDGANNSTDIRDSSRTPKAITAFGDAKISTAQSKWNGSSLAFDGTGDYCQATSSDLRLGSGAFTVEFWVYLSAANVNFLTMQSSTIGWPNVDWWFSFGPFGELRLSRSNGAGFTELFGTFTAISLNTWTHIAFTRDSSNTLRVFYDGVSQTITNTSYAGEMELNATVKPLNVGGFPSWGNMFNGYIDDLRITKGVARYTSNFTPPTQPFQAFIRPDQDPYFYATSLLLHGDGTNGSTNIIDSSPTPKTVTAYGDAQISTAQSKFGGSSIYFDGSGDYLNIGYNGGAFDFGSSDWTVEFWIYLPSLPNAYKRIYSYMNGNTEACFFEITNSNQMTFGIVSGATVFTATDPSAMTSGAWTHFAGVRNGSSLLLFRAGVQVASLSVGTNSANGGSGYEMFIGRWHSADTTRDLNGYIDDLRVTKGVARYTSNFSLPPAPFPNF